jgi:thiol-disulfide isomerase/thioredoxin
MGHAADYPDAEVFYINSSEPCVFFGESMEYYYNRGWGMFFITGDGGDLVADYVGGYHEVTEDIKKDLIALGAVFGEDNPECWKEFCFVPTGEVYEESDWKDVGLLKTGDHQFVYITENPCEMPAFLMLMKRNWVVAEDGESLSFGPYKVKDITDDEFLLEKNENWYGWESDEHLGIFTHAEFGDYDNVILAVAAREEPVSEDEEIEPGETFIFPYEFETLDVYGNEVTEETLGEKEIFFVHFWGTWCGPCVAEMGQMAEIADKYKDRVGFISLLDDFHENAEGAVKLLEGNGLDMLTLAYDTPGLEKVLQMLYSGYVPTTVILDSDGNAIGGQIIGAQGAGYGRLINSALKEVSAR